MTTILIEGVNCYGVTLASSLFSGEKRFMNPVRS